MAIFGNLEGTLKTGFSVGKTDKVYIKNTSGILTLELGIWERLRIETNGTINVSGTSNYEDLVTSDDDIPNKKFVDDINAAANSPMVVTDGLVTEGTSAGTFQVSALTALLRSTNSETGTLTWVSKTLEDNIAITAADTTYYVVLNYNGGTPSVSLSTTNPYDSDYRNIPIGRVRKNTSNDVYTISRCFHLNDGVEKTHCMAGTIRGVVLASGSAIAYSGTNNFTMEAGNFYFGINRYPESAYDSAVTTFIPVYGDGIGGFTEGTPRNTIDYTHYDDGDGTLGELGVAKYGNHWVYRHLDEGDVYVVYGLGNFNLAAAESEQPPPAPAHLTEFGTLIGRITAPQAGGSFTNISMVTDTTFTGTAVSDHGSMSGLGDDDHTQYVLADGSRDITVADDDNESFTINQNDVTNNPEALIISNTGSGDSIQINTDEFTVDQNGNTRIRTGDGPYLRLENSTHEDTDGGRESHLEFKGEQSGGELSTLARITGQHDGAVDDEKGALVFKVNDGNDSDTPTERFKIESDGTLNVAGTTDYETLVTADDDIPNKKYVDDSIPGGGLTVISSNTTYYIATDGNDTTGDGSSGTPWLTIAKTVDYLKDKWVNNDVTVTIQAANGTYSQSTTNNIEHPCSSRIKYQGENRYDYSMTSIQSSSGSPGSYSFILNMSSVANIAVNDYVLIHTLSGGTDPQHMAGCYKVTNVDSGNTRITILSTQNDTNVAAGAVAGTVNILKTMLSHTANSSAFTISDNSSIEFSNIAIVTTNAGASANGITTSLGSNVISTYLGIAGSGSNAGIYAPQSSNVNSSALCISGFTYGLFAWQSATFQLSTFCCSNCTVGVYASDTVSIYMPSSVVTNCGSVNISMLGTSNINLASSKIHNGSTGLQVTTNAGATTTSAIFKDFLSAGINIIDKGTISGGVTISYCGNGINAQYASSANIGSSTVTNCTTGAYAVFASFINRTGSSFSSNTTDYSPALDTVGNEESLIT
jgi:hypothetical protein